MILINLQHTNEYLINNDLPEITEDQVTDNDMIYYLGDDDTKAIKLDYIIDHYAEMQHVNLKDLQSKVVMTVTY